MNQPFDVQEELENFTGHAPLFPLPNVVLFPHMWLPLHVFEPRYRRLVEDALAGDHLIAMALMEPGWEPLYDTKLPMLHPIVGLGRIELDERLPDGRFHLALRGLCRARIETELDSAEPYRTAELTLLPDRYPSFATIDRHHRQHELLAGALELMPELNVAPVLHKLMDASIPLGVLCDLIAQALKLHPAEAQELLSEPDVDSRSDLVLQLLRQRRRNLASGITDRFPPDFSQN